MRRGGSALTGSALTPSLWLVLLLAAAPVSAEDVWWEGEKPVDTNFPSKTWYSPSADEKDLLSGGNWLSSEKPRRGPAAFARYEIEVEEELNANEQREEIGKKGSNRKDDESGCRKCHPHPLLASVACSSCCYWPTSHHCKLRDE